MTDSRKTDGLPENSTQENSTQENTRKLNTENSTHFKHFLEYLCLRLNFFYRFVSWFLPMLTTFQREKQFNIGKNRNHD